MIFTTCSTDTKEVKEEKNIIHLTEAIANPVKMNLSEIVDSIKFVPISSKEHYIRDPKLIFYSKPYIIAFPGCIYNMQGEFVGGVGSVGHGPGEEVGTSFYLTYVRHHRRSLYYLPSYSGQYLCFDPFWS